MENVVFNETESETFKETDLDAFENRLMMEKVFRKRQNSRFVSQDWDVTIWLRCFWEWGVNGKSYLNETESKTFYETVTWQSDLDAFENESMMEKVVWMRQNPRRVFYETDTWQSDLDAFENELVIEKGSKWHVWRRCMNQAKLWQR